MSYPLGTQEADYVVQPSSNNNEFDVKKIVYKIIAVIPWIIIGLAISYTTADLYLRYTPSEHKVGAYLLVKKEDEANLDYKVLKELGVVQAFSDVLNQIDILRSYSLMEKVVDSLKLNIHVRGEGRVTKMQIYGDERPFFLTVIKEADKQTASSYKLQLNRNGFSISGAGIEKKYKYGDTVEVDYGLITLERNPAVKINPQGYRIEFANKHEEAAGLRNALEVGLTNDKGGGLLEISTIDQIPERAIQIINALIIIFNKADLDDKNIVTNKTIKFLSDRVDSVSGELNKIETAAQEFKSSNRILDAALQGSSFQNQALSVDNEKIKQLGQYKILVALENYILSFKNTNDPIPSSMGIGEQILNKLIIQHNELVFEKQMLEQKSSPLDPGLKKLNESILSFRDNLLRNIRLLEKSYQSTAEDLESSYNSLEERIGSLPEKEKKLLGYKRLAGVKEQLYLYLLQKKEEAQLSLASNINNTRVIDYANDLGIKSPNPNQVKLVAILLGILFPIIIMVLKDMLNNKVSDKKEIEAATSVPIIGELAFHKKRKSFIVDASGRSPISEQFRLLRTNLYYAVPERKLKTILVSSFISGEGKSFVSLNLANSLSVTGAKIIILEFDLRNPKLSKMLDMPNETGLSTYISGDQYAEDFIQEVPNFKNTFIITSGPVPSNPAELLLNSKTNTLFDYLKWNFDYIIIDTSPIGLVTDALLLEKHVDLTLFIVRHKFTLKAVLPYIEKLYRDKKFRNMGIVVNGIKKDGSYGYSFGFGYSYSYYLNKKRGFFNKLFSSSGNNRTEV